MAQMYSLQPKSYIFQSKVSNFILLQNSSQLNSLYNAISGKSFIDWAKNLFNKPLDAICSLRVYPFKREALEVDSLQNSIYIGNTTYSIAGSKLKNTSVKRYLIGRYKYVASNFYDYAPYTSIQLYLPFLSFIDIPVNEIANKTMEVYYAVDWSTGMVTATIEVIEANSVNRIIATTSGKVGIELPFGSDSTQEVIKNLISTGVSTAITLSMIGSGKPTGFTELSRTGATAKTLTSVVKANAISQGALSIMNNSQIQYQRGGAVGNITSSMLPTRPYLVVTKPNMISILLSNYEHLYGRPLYETRVLSTMRGFTVVDDVHLVNFPTATSGELDEIERLLKSGVHL